MHHFEIMKYDGVNTDNTSDEVQENVYQFRKFIEYILNSRYEFV